MDKVVIIGAGHAGGTAAALLRQYGFEGRIVLAGSERVPPYQRPPLSKAWLKGHAERDDLLLRPDSFYVEQDITLRLGVTATAIDRAGRSVAFSDGTTETYDALILATGSVARKLAIPGADRPGPIELRTLEDAERLKAVLGPGKRLAVVGGGYVGLEAAASARALGAEVVVIACGIGDPVDLLHRLASGPRCRHRDQSRGRGVRGWGRSAGGWTADRGGCDSGRGGGPGQ
jgi:3-phenylpropionate/trans-cinnamate dioxygenase ferredoxin reductase subunit